MLSFFRKPKNWYVEERVYHVGVREAEVRILDPGLTRRKADKAVKEREDASKLTREMITTCTATLPEKLPTVMYVAKQQS